MRLVNRLFSQYYSLDAIRYFIGSIEKLANNQLLIAMSNLTSLEFYSQSDIPSLRADDIKRLASSIPHSVRHLTSCSMKLVQQLPRQLASTLQTLKVICQALDSRMIPSIKSIFQKFDGRVKHLFLCFYFSFMSPQQVESWRQVLRDLNVEELTIQVDAGDTPADALPLLPVNLKRLTLWNLNVIHDDWISNMPASLESLHTQTSHLNLSSLPPTLKEFTQLNAEVVMGLPPYMPQLQKLELDALEFSVPRGFFNRMPALEKLKLYASDLELIELVPLQHTLTELIICAVNIKNAGDLFSKFTRLKKLHLIVIENNNGFKLDRLPQSLQDLDIYGDLDKGIPMELLPNLKRLGSSIGKSELPINILKNAPSLRNVHFTIAQTGIKAQILEELRGSRFENIQQLGFSDVKQEYLSPLIVQLIATFPNLQCLRICPDGLLSNNKDANFPQQLLSVLKQHDRIGLCLEKVIINSNLKLQDFDNDFIAAVQELTL